MITKRCFKCGKRKDLNSFYKHKGMADGHLNKCKICAKEDGHNRYYNPKFKDKIIEYERKRNQSPERKKNCIIYQQKMREESKGKYRARTKVNNAIRDGRLKKQPCEICGNVNSEAHHNDYRKYLDVHWYCKKHHFGLTKINNKKK